MRKSLDLIFRKLNNITTVFNNITEVRHEVSGWRYSNGWGRCEFASMGGTERGNYGQFPCSSKRAILIERLGETHYTRRPLPDFDTILALPK